MGFEMLQAASDALVIILDPYRMMFLSAGCVLGLVLGILPGIGGLAGSERLDGKGMNVGLHHFADGFVHETVPPHDRQTPETLRHHQHAEVPASLAGAGVADVAVAVVDDFELGRLQGGAQPLLDRRNARSGHGSTLTNGRTSQESKTPSVQ